MEKLLVSTSVQPKKFIGEEEIEVLNDIKIRCFYPTIKERQQFVEVVCRSVGADKFENILEEDFQAAYNCAITILRNHGERILRGCA